MSIEKKKLGIDPLSGEFEFISEDNFSIKEVASGKKTDVRVRQQMIVDGEIVVNGELNVQGEVVLLADPIDEVRYGQDYIPAGDRLIIPSHRQHIITQEMIVLGELVIDGQLVLLP